MSKEIVIDGTGHVAGMLAEKVAKSLFNGDKVVIVRAENIVLLGEIRQRVFDYKDYLNKRCVVNPSRGAFHYKEPSKYFKIKILRGMMARKTKRGTRALANLRVFEGIPREFENVERCVIPRALVSVAADPNLPRCTLGELLSRFGWHYAELAASTSQALLNRENESLKAKKNSEDKAAKLITEQSFKAEVQKRLEEFA